MKPISWFIAIILAIGVIGVIRSTLSNHDEDASGWTTQEKRAYVDLCVSEINADSRNALIVKDPRGLCQCFQRYVAARYDSPEDQYRIDPDSARGQALSRNTIQACT